MEYAHCWGTHFHWFWIVPFLFMILMVICAFRMFRRRGVGYRAGWFPFGCCSPGRGPMERWSGETPDQILDRRYAAGEITKEQYDQMKRDI